MPALLVGAFLLMTAVIGPSGNVLIRFQASKRVSPCIRLVWTCRSSSPGWTAGLRSEATPEGRRERFYLFLISPWVDKAGGAFQRCDPLQKACEIKPSRVA